MDALLPDFVISALERLLCLDRIEELLALGRGMQPLDFIDAIFARLDITYEGIWEDEPRQGRYVFASNHPLAVWTGLCSATAWVGGLAMCASE